LRRSTRVQEALARAVSIRITVSAFSSRRPSCAQQLEDRPARAADIARESLRLIRLPWCNSSIREAEASLIEVGDHLLGVVRILRGTGSEEERLPEWQSDNAPSAAQYPGRKLSPRSHPVRLNGTGAALV